MRCMPATLSLRVPRSPSLLAVSSSKADGRRSAARRSAAWSIYLISSISRLIFFPGLTEGDGAEMEGGRGGRLRATDRPGPAVEKEGEKEESRTTGRPTEMVGSGRCVGVASVMPRFLPSSLLPPLHRPSEIALVSPDFPSPTRRMWQWHHKRRSVARSLTGCCPSQVISSWGLMERDEGFQHPVRTWEAAGG